MTNPAHDDMCGQLRIITALVESAVRHQLGKSDNAALMSELFRMLRALYSAKQLAHGECETVMRRPSWMPEPPVELVERYSDRPPCRAHFK